MSLLYRFTKLQDRADTHVFTFVVTRSVTRDLERDVTSKEFTAGHHRWAITFSRNDKVLGVYLVWRSASEGIRVSADFAFTLLNREHFSANEAFSGRQVKFTAGCPAQGNRNYIPVNDLYGRNFTDSHGEFQLELSIGNVRTLFDTHIRTQQTLFFGLGVGGGGGSGNKSDSEAHQHTNHHHHKHRGHHKHQQSPQPEVGRQGSSRHSSPRRTGHNSTTASDGMLSASEETTAGVGAAAGRGKKQSLTKYETAHFTFGGFDWNVCVYPTGDGSPAAEEGRGTSGRRRGGSSSGRMSVYLNRLTGFDHQCRLRYSLSLGEGDRRLDSGPVEDHSDAEGRGLGWHPRARITDLVSRRGGGGGGGGALLRVRLEMIEARTLSEVAIAAAGLSGGLLSPGMPTSIGNTLRPVSPSASSYSIAAASPLSSVAPSGVLGGSASPSSPSAAHHGLLSNANSPPGGTSAGPCSSQCYDRDKQAWIIRTDTHSETVRLHMVFKDVQNVPRNHLRYVCWTAFLLRYHHKSGLVEPVALPGGPFSHYYAQDVSDEGIIMETDVPVKEMREPDCPYLTEKGQVRVRVEWGECHLLFQATYHKYDDVSRIHNHQMRREISALQAENYSLERQLFSYQKSIAYAHSRGSSYPDELASPSQDLGDYTRRGVGEGEEGNGGGMMGGVGGSSRSRTHRSRRRRLCGGEGVGGGGPIEGDEDDDEDYYNEDGGGGGGMGVGGRAYSLGDRSLSTDTEYA